jgi:hypothetical protein
MASALSGNDHGVVSRIGQVIHSFAAFVEKHKVLVVSCYSLLFLTICTLLAATRPMWYDEMATYYPAKLPTVGALVDFFWKALDMHTPAASLAVRGAIALFGDNPVAARLPMMLGFLVFSISIFIFVAARCPAVYALAAMIFPAVTLMFYYSTEMRCYGLVLGMAGLALVCWQAAADGRRRRLALAGLLVSLVGVVCCHYYAIFLWIPLGLAELTRTWIRKRIDWPIWSVLLASPLVLLVFLTPIRLARNTYAAGMFSKPHWSDIARSYQSLLGISDLPILGIAILCLLLGPRFSRAVPGWVAPPLADWVLAVSLSLLPAFVVPASFLTGAYFDRYSLSCAAGVAILLVFALCQAMRGDRFVATLLALGLLGWFVFKSVPQARAQAFENGGLSTPVGQSFRTAGWVRELERSQLPIAASGALFYMQLQYYAPGPVRRRVYYLADAQMELRYEGASSTDITLPRFRQALPLQVVDFHEFVSRTPHFLLCLDTAWPYWLSSALLDGGAQLRLLNQSDPFSVYEVNMPPQASPPVTTPGAGKDASGPTRRRK